MIRGVRSRSLFWTFAGAFLLVLIVAAVIQAVMVIAVVGPLSHRVMAGRAEVQALEAAEKIASGSGSDEEINAVLREFRGEDRVYLAFRKPEGQVLTGNQGRGGRFLARRLAEVIEGREPSRPPEIEGGPGEDDAGPPDRGDRPPRGRGFRDRPPERIQVLARREVSLAGATLGEVVALGPESRFLRPPGVPFHLFLFLPVAVLVAGGAGLVLFRLLIRRLRAMEALAARVAEGDLSARIPDTGTDEIGLLGSRLNRMTESLSRARETLEASDNQRRQLLADISHELATPLTSIRGYAETLLDDSVSVSEAERKEYLENVLAESERMDLLISDLFELTRLEAGAVELVRERLDWTALCFNTMKRLAPRFTEAGLGLCWEGPVEEAWVSADGRRLEQALDNILLNALRYVPSGGEVVLSMTCEDSGEFRVRVRDNGPGIPAEALPHVFDRFFRADPARSPGGTGLGLAIVREVLRRHDGEVWAEAAEPRGTVFVMELPGGG